MKNTLNDIRILLTVLCMISYSCSAQQIIPLLEEIQFSKYSTEDSEFFIASVDLDNTSDHQIIIWFDSEDISNYSDDRRVKQFFFQRNFDFSLYDLLSENLLVSDDLVLGHSLYKVLHPGEIFTIHFYTSELFDARRVQIWLNQHCAAFNLDTIRKTLSIENLEDTSFQSEDLILSLPLFEKN